MTKPPDLNRVMPMLRGMKEGKVQLFEGAWHPSIVGERIAQDYRGFAVFSSIRDRGLQEAVVAAVHAYVEAHPELVQQPRTTEEDGE